MRTEYLTERQLVELLDRLPPVPRLVCEVALATGLRVGDVVALRKRQIAPVMRVTERKTGKVREVELPSDLVRRVKRQAGRRWAFPGARDPDRHRTRQGIWAAVKRAAKAAEMPSNVAPHSLRKVYAVRALDASGGNLRAVQGALGHDNLDTTLLYAMARELYQAKYGRGDGDAGGCQGDGPTHG